MTHDQTTKTLLTIVLALLLVGVGGVYYLIFKENRVQPVPTPAAPTTPTQPTPLPTTMPPTTPTTPPAPTTGAGTTTASAWKTYADAASGYTIQYPGEWLYERPSTGTVIFRAEPGGQWVYQIEVEPTTKTLQSIAATQRADYKKVNAELQGDIDMTATTIDGQPAMRMFTHNLESAGPGQTYFLVVYKGNLYTITPGMESSPESVSILQSFNFTK